MIKKNQKISILIFLIILLPISLLLLEKYDDSRGLIWFFLHQIYYMPLGVWLKEPFFRPDSEIMFHVLALGRFLTGMVYAIIFYFLFVIFKKIKRKKKNYHWRR